MFKINVSSGLTFILDYSKQAESHDIITKMKSADFQRTITAVSIVEECGKATKCVRCGRKVTVFCMDCGEDDDAHCNMGVQYSLPRPKDCERVFFLLEDVEPNKRTKGYERIQCFADGIQIVATVHKGQPSVCVVLHKKGKMRYNPFVD